MEDLCKILIYGRPGHYRESLAAVLKTLPGSELFLVNNLEQGDWSQDPRGTLTLIFADPDILSRSDDIRVERLRSQFPDLRCIALVDNASQSRTARDVGADLVLSRSASAGELLNKILLVNERIRQMTWTQSLSPIPEMRA